MDVETLVQMWIGEGLVNTEELGRWYVKLLVERYLFESIGNDMMHIKVHDVVRSMAIYIAEKEENCLFSTAQNLKMFPTEGIGNCKRIAFGFNNSPTLPTDFRCPQLVTLILSRNRSLREVSNCFLCNLFSLRVLDLSNTNVESLPASMCQLIGVEFLKLSGTLIKCLPEGIWNLSSLQFLHLDSCRELKSLPSNIEELKNLKHLNLDACDRLSWIPFGISQLTSLIKLQLIIGVHGLLNVEKAESCRLKDLTNFQNLLDLSLVVKPRLKVNGIWSGIKAGIMATWLAMRKLTLKFDLDVDERRYSTGGPSPRYAEAGEILY